MTRKSLPDAAARGIKLINAVQLDRDGAGLEECIPDTMPRLALACSRDILPSAFRPCRVDESDQAASLGMRTVRFNSSSVYAYSLATRICRSEWM